MSRDDERLQRYFDGDLRRGDARELEAALPTNEPDRKRLAALEEMRALLRGSAQEAAASAPSDVMWTTIRAEIAKGFRPPAIERLLVRCREWWSGPARIWVPATVVAACLMLTWVLAERTRASVGRAVVIESVETTGVTATVFQIPGESDGDGIAVLVLTPQPEGGEE